MFSVLNTPEVELVLFVDFLLVVILGVACFKSIEILVRYKKESYTPLQYKLEKQSYLVATIIKLSLFAELFLLPFFAHTLDALSSLIPGAMCAAGVVNGGVYGNVLVGMKFFIIIVAMVWLKLNTQDLREKTVPYFRLKHLFFLGIYLLMVISTIIEFKFFASLSTQDLVMCCSTLYKTTHNPLPFSLDIGSVVTIFLGSFVAVLGGVYVAQRVVLLVSMVLFTYFGYYALVYFFTPYIYELPTHKCPYCILSSDYHFIGYFIYGAFIFMSYYVSLGVLFGVTQEVKKKIVISGLLFLLFLSFHFVVYYVKNGVVL